MGLNFRTDDTDQHTYRWAVGTDIQPFEILTFTADVIGEHLMDRSEDVGEDIFGVAGGIKVNPWGRLVLSGNALVRSMATACAPTRFHRSRSNTPSDTTRRAEPLPGVTGGIACACGSVSGSVWGSCSHPTRAGPAPSSSARSAAMPRRPRGSPLR
jgi:hypothetical protein